MRDARHGLLGARPHTLKLCSLKPMTWHSVLAGAWNSSRRRSQTPCADGCCSKTLSIWSSTRFGSRSNEPARGENAHARRWHQQPTPPWGRGVAGSRTDARGGVRTDERLHVAHEGVGEVRRAAAREPRVELDGQLGVALTLLAEQVELLLLVAVGLVTVRTRRRGQGWERPRSGPRGSTFCCGNESRTRGRC